MFNVEKFDVMNDFGLWHITIKVLPMQHGLEGPVEGEATLTPTLPDVEKSSIMVKALA